MPKHGPDLLQTLISTPDRTSMSRTPLGLVFIWLAAFFCPATLPKSCQSGSSGAFSKEVPARFGTE